MKMDQVSMQILLRFPIFEIIDSITLCVISSYCNILHCDQRKLCYQNDCCNSEKYISRLYTCQEHYVSKTCISQ